MDMAQDGELLLDTLRSPTFAKRTRQKKKKKKKIKKSKDTFGNEKFKIISCD